MKYVMLKVKCGDITHFYPVIFPNILVHADVARAMQAVIRMGAVVHSAGEFNCDDPLCYGKSETLGVKSDEKDDHRIMMCDYGGCIE